MQVKITFYILSTLFRLKKPYLKCSLNLSLGWKGPVKASRFCTESPGFVNDFS